MIEYIESILPISGTNKGLVTSPYGRMESHLSGRASLSGKGTLSKVSSDGSLSAYEDESERLSMKIDHEVNSDEPSTFHKLVRQNSEAVATQ